MRCSTDITSTQQASFDLAWLGHTCLKTIPNPYLILCRIRFCQRKSLSRLVQKGYQFDQFELQLPTDLLHSEVLFHLIVSVSKAMNLPSQARARAKLAEIQTEVHLLDFTGGVPI